MTKAFFDKFPTVDYYNNLKLRNIILNAKFVSDIFDKFDVFYPYVIQEWERPDTIAADYYGDPKYFWVVLMSNKIVDPVTEWPKNYYDFQRFIETKYSMTVDETKRHILYYQFTGVGGNFNQDLIDRKTWTMPVETYNYLSRQMTGTLNLNNANGQIITGTNTIFEIELEAGDQIVINTGSENEIRTISSIVSNTEMIIDSDVLQSNTAATFKLYHSPTGLEDAFSIDGWNPVYAYDYEVEQNDLKRSIKLLDASYISEVENQLKYIFR